MRRQSYTAKELAELHHVPEKVVVAWIKRKWIRGQKDKYDPLFPHAPRYYRVPITENPVVAKLARGASPEEARAANREVDERVEAAK